MRFYELVLGVLALWRITHLLNAEDGPWDVLVRLRVWTGQGFWGRVSDCFYCLSLWLAIPLAVLLGQGWRERLLLWLALSGGAILLERWTGDKAETPIVHDRESEKRESKEIEHELLWREAAKPETGSKAEN